MAKRVSPVRDLVAFRSRLLGWYRRNRRDLPWRQTRDPYRIWVSEIMLQQTRVAAVVDRYEQFLKRFPTVQKLAAARESSVLAEWSGLGYYRRARNLHAAAKSVVSEFSGTFPNRSQELRKLPGIGRYTAAAVASIAFQEPVAVVDGNVERVVQRLTGNPNISADNVWATAEQLLSREHPGDFNQAMMELGATICLPAEPHCRACPVLKFCRTLGTHESAAKKPRLLKRKVTFALSRQNGSVLLVQRSASERLMPRMWELPQVSADAADEELFSLRHAITVTSFTVRVVSGKFPGTGTWVDNTRLQKLPLTGLTTKILKRAGIIQQ